VVKYAFVIDLARCVGCRSCVEACKVENNTTKGIFWMDVFKLEEGEYPNVKYSFLPRPCMHCDHPSCVPVCPVGARFKREDGLVLTDFDRCIGCRYCILACPYGVGYFNWKRPEKNEYFDWEADGRNIHGSGELKDETRGVLPPHKNPDHERKYDDALVSGGSHYVGVAEKCTWCVHRLEKGLSPACVHMCPMFVLNFGDLDDEGSTVSELLATRPHFRLLEELGNEPNVYYINRAPPSKEVRNLDIRRKWE
jgi:molybdopterin-containing oxidoreductase family iron-sulfur binding subunit